MVAGLPATLKGQPVHRVRCSGGQTIANALKAASPGDVIRIQGTCRESFVVTTDHLTIEGEGDAAIQGAGGGPKVGAPQIDVRSAQGVIIRNLIVQDATGEAIQVTDGSAATLENVTVRRSTVGLVVYVAVIGEVEGCSSAREFRRHPCRSQQRCSTGG
jgi:nitrous oxidase accessory protein NosD